MCHLKDRLFHGVCKHIRDSIRYLHSNPKTTYSQLMVAARKVESKMEDAKENVRARSSAATEVKDSSNELGDLITKLMATLTRAELGTCPATTPNSPRHRGIGEGRWTGILLPAPAPTIRLAWVRAPPLTVLLLQVGWPLLPQVGEYPSTNRCHRQCPKHEGPQCSTMF